MRDDRRRDRRRRAVDDAEARLRRQHADLCRVLPRNAHSGGARGTALGDFVATTTGLGFVRGALVFGGLIALVAAAHFFTRIPKSALFWSAYVLTRPLGATLGDTLTKPHAQGGLALSRITSSLVIAAAMVAGIFLTDRKEKRRLMPNT